MQLRMRYLRQKYNISLQELAVHSQVSVQRLSQIELESEPKTNHMNRLVEQAFYRYILQRRSHLSQLEKDLDRDGKHLLEQVNEEEEFS